MWSTQCQADVVVPQAVPCFAQPEPHGLLRCPDGAAPLPEAAAEADCRQASVGLGQSLWVVGRTAAPHAQQILSGR